MNEKKKAQDRGPAPNAHHHYIKADNACLIIFFISIIVLFIGEALNHTACIYTGVGMLFASSMISMILQEDK